MTTLYFTPNGNIQPPATTTLTTTNETAILTSASSAPYEVIGVQAVNTDASNACWLKLFWNDGSTSYQFFYESLAASAMLTREVVLPIWLYPRASDGSGVAKKLMAQAQNANDLVVTVVYSIIQPQKTRGMDGGGGIA